MMAPTIHNNGVLLPESDTSNRKYAEYKSGDKQTVRSNG
jgi:hypothetical protein